MIPNLDRNEVLQPYEKLPKADLWCLEILAADGPEPEDVERALNHLLDRIEIRLPDASEKEAKHSITAAMAAVLPPPQEDYPRAACRGYFRQRLLRWFADVNQGSGPGDADDVPGGEQRVRRRKSKKHDDDVLE